MKIVKFDRIGSNKGSKDAHWRDESKFERISSIGLQGAEIWTFKDYALVWCNNFRYDVYQKNLKKLFLESENFLRIIGVFCDFSPLGTTVNEYME